MSGRPDISLHSLSHASLASKNKINSHPPRSTLLPHVVLSFAPACGARLPALLDATRGYPLSVSVQYCLRVAAAWLSALPGVQPPMSRGARLPALLGIAWGYCLTASTRGHCLPALSRSHRRAASYKCMMKAYVSSVPELCYKCVVWMMLQK
jgi:hypothetical protein